jgi:hypothetical protein
MVRTPEIQGLLLEDKKKAAPSSPEVLDRPFYLVAGDARSWPGGQTYRGWGRRRRRLVRIIGKKEDGGAWLDPIVGRRHLA